MREMELRTTTQIGAMTLPPGGALVAVEFLGH